MKKTGKGVRECPFIGDSSIAEALKMCHRAGFKPTYMPYIVDRRIAAPRNDPLWTEMYDTLSMHVIGETKQGNEVDIYVHVPHFLSSPENIERERNDYGNLELPKKELIRLLNTQDDKTIFVRDHKAVLKFIEKNEEEIDIPVYSLERAIEHPHLIPALGGESRTRQYLSKLRKLGGKNICIWYDSEKASDYPTFLSIGPIDQSDKYSSSIEDHTHCFAYGDDPFDVEILGIK